MMWRFVYALMLSAACLAQQQQQQVQQQVQQQAARYSSVPDRPLRLEDIERDSLSSSAQQRPATTQQQQQQQQQQPSVQQLAAYQQQQQQHLLLQQYYQPQPFLPVMLVHSNHLGVGGPSVQAYLLPGPIDPYQGAQFYQTLQTPQQVYVQPQGVTGQRYNPQRLVQQPQRLQPIVAQPLNYQVPPQQYSPQQFTSQQYNPQQQYNSQPAYNAYNAIYQQRQKFGAGVKSTVAPPLKDNTPQQQFTQTAASQGSNYNNYKQF